MNSTNQERVFPKLRLSKLPSFSLIERKVIELKSQKALINEPSPSSFSVEGEATDIKKNEKPKEKPKNDKAEFKRPYHIQKNSSDYVKKKVVLDNARDRPWLPNISHVDKNSNQDSDVSAVDTLSIDKLWVGRSLHRFPLQVCDIKNLKKLDLSKNYFLKLTLKCGLHKLVHLTHFKANLCGLNKVPLDLLKLPLLQELELAGNAIHQLPYNIHYMKKLIYLDLSNNEITKIPYNLWHLVHLQILKLSRNKIKTISKAIFALHFLKKLYLHENRLKNLPIGFSKLKELKYVSLYMNKISQESIQELMKELKDCEIK